MSHISRSSKLVNERSWVDVCLKLISRGRRLLRSALTTSSAERPPFLIQIYELLVKMMIKVWTREQFLH